MSSPPTGPGPGTTDGPPDEQSAATVRAADSEVEARLVDALERVAHGAVVSVPCMVIERGLALAFTVVLTNGFAPRSFGLFALARRLQQYLSRLALGFRRGLVRFLPTAASAAERDVLVTFAALLLSAVATTAGAALFVAAPMLAAAAGEGPRFAVFLRILAAGLPAAVWMHTVAEVLRGLEEIGPFNLTVRVGFPLLQLVVGLVGTFVFRDLAAVAGGVLAAMALAGTAAAAWLARERGLRPRIQSDTASSLRRRYLRFTVPLFLEGFATITQRLGYYPLIAVFLSGTAGGVFVVGVLLGRLVRLPLAGVNQFISPVAADLHDAGHGRALARLYHVTSRLAFTGVTGLAVPLIIYRRSVMALFGDVFVAHAALVPWFALAMVAAAAAGSVGFLLPMTDHERALLAVNAAVTVVLAVTAVPLTARYGLGGLAASYFGMVVLNNGLEVAVLFYLESLQPFTQAHAKPLVAAVPLAATALLVRGLPLPGRPVLGTILGLATYAGTLASLGFDPVERRLARTVATHYRTTLPGVADS